jgi:opacity protein-like surface antigen
MSSEPESTSGESRPNGVLGHTIIRLYGAIIPEVQDYTLDGAGWGAGFAVSYGVARAVQISLEVAYHRFPIFEGTGIPESRTTSSWNAVRHSSMSVVLQSPTRSRLRPWLGAGFGVYEMTETREGIDYYYPGEYRYKSVTSGTKLGANWGVGVSVRLDQRLAIDVGGRYQHSFGLAFLTADQYMDGARLLSVQAGLSYVVR